MTGMDTTEKDQALVSALEALREAQAVMENAHAEARRASMREAEADNRLSDAQKAFDKAFAEIRGSRT